jgi:DNA polymerase-3 subunit delta
MLEPAPDAVAISCYAEVGHALEASLAALLAEAGVRAEADALDWLKTHLGADRAMQRRAAETLALLVGPGGTVRLSDVAACLGDAASFSMEDAAFAAGLGEEAALDRALGHALAEGMAPVGVLRAAMTHFQRLHRARIMVDLGMPPEQAIRSLRPPVFWKREAGFRATLGLWSARRLAAALAAFQKAERGCKRTGAPADTICRAALQRVGHQARLLRNPASASREER